MCDPGHSGSDCSVPDTPNPDFLKEDFEGTHRNQEITVYRKRISEGTCVMCIGAQKIMVFSFSVHKMMDSCFCVYCCVCFFYILVSVGGAVDAERFRLLSGGKPSRKCGIMSSGNHLFFSEDGLRMLVTNDMDLANAR